MILGTLIAYIVLQVYIGYWPVPDHLYFFLDQLCDVLILSAIAQVLKEGVGKAFATGMLTLATFELIDDILTENTSIQPSDYIGLILGIITTLYYCRKWNSLKPK